MRLSTTLPGGRKVSEEACAEMSELWGFEVPTMKDSPVPMVKAAYAEEIDFLYNVGGNLLHTMPDPDRVAEAMGRVAMRIHQDIVVNASMLIDPGEVLVLLPAQTRYEQRGGGTSTSTERRSRFSPEIPGHPQVGEARPGGDSLSSGDDCRPEPEGRLRIPGTPRTSAMRWARPCPSTRASRRSVRRATRFSGAVLTCALTASRTCPRSARASRCSIPPSRLAPEGQWMLTTRRGKQFNSIIIKSKDHLQGVVIATIST